MRCSICDFNTSGLITHDYGPEYKKAKILWDKINEEFVCSVCQAEVSSVEWPLETDGEESGTSV